MEKYLFYFLIVQIYSVPIWAVELQFESIMKIKKNDVNEFLEVGPQAPLTLKKGESALISHPLGLPVLVIVPKEESSKLTITSNELLNLTDLQVAKVVNQRVNEILIEMRKAESFVNKKNYTQALAVLQNLKNKYDQIAPIYFMSATVSYLLNDRKSAIDELEKGLKLQPEDQVAKNLLEKLKANK
jgi:tetratricopeptide (TPR) repeat protein